MNESALELEVFKAVNFDPVVKLDEVWQCAPFHIDALHTAERGKILARLTQVQTGGVSGGCVLTGVAGSGKTHLIGSLRQEFHDRPEFRDVAFLYADMWAVTPGNFWPVLLAKAVHSLMRKRDEEDDALQFQSLLLCLLKYLNKMGEGARTYLRILENSESGWIDRDVCKICGALKKERGALSGGIRDVLRALFALNCEDERADFAQAWLCGGMLEKKQQEQLCLSVARQNPLELFSSLVWLLNLRGVVFLAVDQIDSIAQGNSTETLSMVTELTNGLASIVSSMPGILVLLAAFMDSWENIKKISPSSDLARFSGHGTLGHIPDELLAQALVANRMHAVYRHKRFIAAYPTWPFRKEAFKECLITPRELLVRCARHQDACVARNRLDELVSFVSQAEKSVVPLHGLRDFSARFAARRLEAASAELSGFLDEDREDELGELIEFACSLLLIENPPLGGRDAAVLKREYPNRAIKPLHALIEFNGGEKYYAFRVLQKTIHTAYGPRLKAAMEASGLAKGLFTRHLTVFRSTPLPTTPKMSELTRCFSDEGGHIVSIAEEQVSLLLALKRMREEKETGFESWLQEQRPISFSGLFAPILQELSSDLTAPASAPVGERPLSDFFTRASASMSNGNDVIEVSSKKEEILLGSSSSLVGQVCPAALPLRTLCAHAVVLAGSGCGKTLLLRRIVDQSALFGIPSIFIDNSIDTDSPSDLLKIFDVAELLEGRGEGGAARVSTVRFGGVHSLSRKQSFIERLTGDLFARLVKKSSQDGRLNALLAIDEARDFICADKNSLLHLAARASQFGLGLVLSTRQPADIDYKALGGVGTWFLGRAQSPQALAKLEGLVQEWGGTMGRIPHLKTGEFLMRSADIPPRPVKISVAAESTAYGDALPWNDVRVGVIK